MKPTIITFLAFFLLIQCKSISQAKVIRQNFENNTKTISVTKNKWAKEEVAKKNLEAAIDCEGFTKIEEGHEEAPYDSTFTKYYLTYKCPEASEESEEDDDSDSSEEDEETSDS